MTYGELRAVLNFLNDIRNDVNRKDFDKVIERVKNVKDYEQILDEWKYFKGEEKKDGNL